MNYLQVIEYSNQRILTTQQLAKAYETDTNNIYVNFQRNKDRYTEGKHYFSLEGETLKTFKGSLQFEGNLMDKYAPILYLWTEKGALMHAKSLNTDQAWTAYEILIDDYYRLRTSPLQGMHLDAINEQVTSLLAQIHDVKLNAREAANELKRAKRMAARTERLERKAIAAPPTPTPAVEPQRKPTSVSVEEIILEVLCSLPAGDMVTSRFISRHTLILRKLGAPAIRIVLGRMQETGIIVKEGHGASARYALR